MATAPSPNDLTRQQLDELDALLQRMLSVPLSPVDTPMPVGAPTLPTPPTSATPSPTPAAPPSWRIDAPAPDATPAPHLLLIEPPSSVSLKADVPPPAPVPAHAPVPTPPIASPATPKLPAPAAPTVPIPATLAPTLAQAIQAQAAQSSAAVPALAPTRPTAPAPAPAPGPSTSQTLRVTPAPTTQPLPVVFLPFVILNLLFDNVCGLLGPFGRVLRSSPFKYLYGLIGLGLLAYTAAHVAQEKEWLTLPAKLPWPPKPSHH